MISVTSTLLNIAKILQLDWFIYLDADEFLILNKMFTKMFGQKTAITNFDVRASSFGIITEDFLGERLDDRRNSTNPDFYKETQRLIEQYGEQKKRMTKIVVYTITLLFYFAKKRPIF